MRPTPAKTIALLGPLVGDVIQYHASQGAINQIMGGDIAALFLVAPQSSTSPPPGSGRLPSAVKDRSVRTWLSIGLIER